MSEFRVGDEVCLQRMVASIIAVEGNKVTFTYDGDTSLKFRDYAHKLRLVMRTDELDPADPPPAQPDELQAAREAYEEAETALEASTSPAPRGAWVMLGNAAAEYIDALEAAHAARQQRIEELERALKEVEELALEWLGDWGATDTDDEFLRRQGMFDILVYRQMRRIAHAALHAADADEKGEQG